MKRKIQIIIVDDNPTFLDGVKTFLSRESDYEIIAEFSSSTALLEKINDYDPDLILLDIEMPDLNGIETARRLSSYGIDLRLVAISLYYDNIYFRHLLEAGFKGFVNKNKVSEKLCQVIESVMKDQLAFPEIPVLEQCKF
jgi:two-component system, NarL family, response regulator DegU